LSPDACCYTRRDEMLANSEYITTLHPYSPLVKKPDSENTALSIRSQRAKCPGYSLALRDSL